MTDVPVPLAARRHVRMSQVATLSTLSVAEGIEGSPFGSVVPYVTDTEAAPIVLVSRIAQHTKNLVADPRASLLIRPEAGEDDAQANWRVTLVGSFFRLVDTPSGQPGDERVLDADEFRALKARYLEKVPRAREYHATHDFDYWRLEIRKVRFIGGFGRIRWVEPADLAAVPEAEDLAEAAAGIITHMNEDHADALLDYFEAFRGVRPEKARLLAVDTGGFLVECEGPDDVGYFSFDREIGAGEARGAFVDLLGRARKMLQAP